MTLLGIDGCEDICEETLLSLIVCARYLQSGAWAEVAEAVAEVANDPEAATPVPALDPQGCETLFTKVCNSLNIGGEPDAKARAHKASVILAQRRAKQIRANIALIDSSINLLEADEIAVDSPNVDLSVIKAHVEDSKKLFFSMPHPSDTVAAMDVDAVAPRPAQSSASAAANGGRKQSSPAKGTGGLMPGVASVVAARIVAQESRSPPPKKQRLIPQKVPVSQMGQISSSTGPPPPKTVVARPAQLAEPSNSSAAQADNARSTTKPAEVSHAGTAVGNLQASQSLPVASSQAVQTPVVAGFRDSSMDLLSSTPVLKLSPVRPATSAVAAVPVSKGLVGRAESPSGRALPSTVSLPSSEPSRPSPAVKNIQALPPTRASPVITSQTTVVKHAASPGRKRPGKPVASPGTTSSQGGVHDAVDKVKPAMPSEPAAAAEVKQQPKKRSRSTGKARLSVPDAPDDEPSITEEERSVQTGKTGSAVDEEDTDDEPVLLRRSGDAGDATKVKRSSKRLRTASPRRREDTTTPDGVRTSEEQGTDGSGTRRAVAKPSTGKARRPTAKAAPTASGTPTVKRPVGRPRKHPAPPQ
ncbi:Uncharacterized protein PBTT_07108 [Plasmodiophora brassicae]